MDNITQGVIGGSLYTLITGKHTNKTFRLGAGIANIPDLDVFVARLLPLSPMDAQFFHRGIMHSIIFNVVLAFALAFCLYRSDRSVSYWRYVLATFISILFGHLLIDGMTSYGMRYRLPFSGKTYSTDNIFVVDFGMWIVTIAGLILYMISQAKQKIAKYILIAVGIYISFTFVIQGYVTQVFESHYPKRGLPIKVLDAHTLAEPLQPLLRRHVIKTPRGYYEGYYSLFDHDQKIDRKRSEISKTGQQLVSLLSQQDSPLEKDLAHVISFSRDNYRVIPSEQEGTYTIENMMFGALNGRQEGAQRMFNFTLVQSGSDYKILSARNDRRGSLMKTVWTDFWNRVFGNKQ